MNRSATTILLCVISLLIASTAFAQGRQDFTLINKTGVDIHELYVCPHASDNWEEDILGEDVLPNGQSLAINFARKETAKLWDLKIVDGSGASIEWENFNLLKISEITLYMDKKGKVWAESK